MKTFVLGVWHVVRYAIATGVSTAVAAILPVAISCIPIALAIVWVLAWGIALVLYALTGDPSGIEMEEPLGIILVPLLLLVFGIVSAIISLVLAIAFGILIVLPISLAIELACWRLPIRAAMPRLGSFLLAGLFLGAMLAVLLLAIGGFQQVQASPLPWLGAAAWLSSTGIGAVFASGLVLVSMSFVKERAIAVYKQQSHVHLSIRPS